MSGTAAGLAPLSATTPQPSLRITTQDNFPRGFCFPPALLRTPSLTVQAWEMRMMLWAHEVAMHETSAFAHVRGQEIPVSGIISVEDSLSLDPNISNWRTAQLFWKNGVFALRVQEHEADEHSSRVLHTQWTSFLKATRLIPFIKQGLTMESIILTLETAEASSRVAAQARS